ncbi:MAG: Ryanodine receptor Ryr [Muribaculaceae bacterium]|nr:Ryanodine receptor Ryr [Muribaculaceae bacterium]
MVTSSCDKEGYNPQPIDVEDIILDSDLEELTEAIAENAHDIWARARMDEGWTYGPVRNDALKQHPDLVPYSRLPESEKEYDRLMAMNTLRLVHRLGFKIENTLPQT